MSDIQRELEDLVDSLSDSGNRLNTKIEYHKDVNYVHSQSISSSRWDIYHNLGKKVSVTVTDSAGTVVEGRITINDGIRVTVEFNSPFSGEAVLN